MRSSIGSTFAGLHSVACAEIFEEHQVIMIEIGDVEQRDPKRTTTASLVGSTLAVKLIKLCPITLISGENF